MTDSFIQKVTLEHANAVRFPSVKLVHDWAENLLSFLFPELCGERCANESQVLDRLAKVRLGLHEFLLQMEQDFNVDPDKLCDAFFDDIESIYNQLREDVNTINMGDPASRGVLEVVLTYPGFYAIAFYRIAHKLHQLEVPMIPRIITEFASSKTGIEIHPAAQIGHRFCIDHGTGVVIGETCIIGDDVKIYQGVTLGALSVAKDMADTKRHPTIKDDVVIYSGATILGGETVVGEHSIIGGNVWLTKSVPANSVIYHQPQIKVRNSDTNEKEV